MTKEQQISTLTTIRDMNDAAAKELTDRYGTGVRPSWVSSELAVRWERSERAQDRIDELEEENG